MKKTIMALSVLLSLPVWGVEPYLQDKLKISLLRQDLTSSFKSFQTDINYSNGIRAISLTYISQKAKDFEDIYEKTCKNIPSETLSSLLLEENLKDLKGCIEILNDNISKNKHTEQHIISFFESKKTEPGIISSQESLSKLSNLKKISEVLDCLIQSSDKHKNISDQKNIEKSNLSHSDSSEQILSEYHAKEQALSQEKENLAYDFVTGFFNKYDEKTLFESEK